MSINQSEVEKIKSAIDPIEIYKRYLNLKRTGNSYQAKCPFHNGNTNSSFVINANNGLWKCFGACDTGGDFISFYMKMEHVSFLEACMKLSEEFNIEIEIDSKTKKEMKFKKLLRTINYSVMLYYKNNLKLNDEALEYLKEREISEDIIRKFNIGATYLNDLSKVFSKYDKYLKILRLTTAKGNDFFRNNRIIIPIYDEYNNIQGFNSRIIGNSDDEVKYMNSMESVLFDKKETLFGINHAIEEIKKRKYVYVVEGIFDCLRAHQNNIKNCVALNGVAIHEYQIKKLSRHAKRIFLCLDSDETGIKRIGPIFDKIKEVSPFTQVKIIELPKDEGVKKIDFDEYVLKNGRESFIDLARTAKTYEDFIVDYSTRKIDYSSTEDKYSILYYIRPYFQKIADVQKKESIIENIYPKLNLPQVDVRRILCRAQETDIVEGIKEKFDKKEIVAQKFLIALLFCNVDYNITLKLFKEKNIDKYFSTGFLKIYKKINKMLLQNITIDDIIKNISSISNKMSKLMSDIFFKGSIELEYIDEENIEEFIDDNLIILEK